MFNFTLVNFSEVMSDGSPLSGCTNPNSVIEFINNATQGISADCVRYSHLLEAGLFCAFAIMVLAEWLNHNKIKRLESQNKELLLLVKNDGGVGNAGQKGG